jgi:hypothetical protein
LPPDNPNRLPRNYAELRELYRLAGKPEPLLPPDNSIPLPRSYGELTLAGGGLAVYIENQGGSLWGIECSSLDKPDPPVVIALDIDQPVWEPFHDCLSGFLVAMFYHQASHLGLRYGAVADADAALVERVKRHWPLATRFGNVCVVFDEEDDREEFYSQGGIILSFRDENLRVSTRTQEQREAVQQELGIQWTWLFPEQFPAIYSTLRDGWED